MPPPSYFIFSSKRPTAIAICVWLALNFSTAERNREISDAMNQPTAATAIGPAYIQKSLISF